MPLHHALAQLARHVVEHGNHHDDQQQRHADLIVAVEFNVGHQLLADAARAHQPQNGRLTEVDLQPHEAVGEKHRLHLRPQAEAHALQRRGAAGRQPAHRFVGGGFDRFVEQLGQAADGVQRQRQEAGNGADAERHHEHHRPRQLRHGAQNATSVRIASRTEAGV